MEKAVRQAHGPDRVVAAVLTRDLRVLLCHRSPQKKWYPNVWDLPGGHVEPGEAPPQALVRELEEELGVRIAAPALAPLEVLIIPAEGGTTGVELRIWHVTEWQGKVRNAAPEEHDQMGFYGLAELTALEMAHPALLPILTVCLQPARAGRAARP